MFLKWLIPLVLFFYQSALISAEYRLALCSMFKNESSWICEWVEYHRMLGVEHFYLYDNESTDDGIEILKPYIQEGLVEVIPWSNTINHWDPRGSRFDGYQIKAFNDCIKRTVDIAEWLAIIDIDEFIVPTQGKESLLALLDKEYCKNTGTLKFQTRVFGTSDVWQIPQGSLMIEMLTWRAADNHPLHSIVKCIHRPEAVADCLVNDAFLKSEYAKKTIYPPFIHVNHYWCRDKREFLKKRFNLDLETEPQDLLEFLPEEKYRTFLRLVLELDFVEDKAILQYVPELKMQRP